MQYVNNIMTRKNNLRKIYWIRCIGLLCIGYIYYCTPAVYSTLEERRCYSRSPFRLRLSYAVAADTLIVWAFHDLNIKYFLARAHERLIRYCLTQLKNKYLFFRWATMQYIPQPLLTSLVLLVNSIGNEIFLRCTSSTICRVDCFLSFNRNYYNIVWRISSGSIVPSWGNKAEVDLLLHQRQVDA